MLAEKTRTQDDESHRPLFPVRKLEIWGGFSLLLLLLLCCHGRCRRRQANMPTTSSSLPPSLSLASDFCLPFPFPLSFHSLCPLFSLPTLDIPCNEENVLSFYNFHLPAARLRGFNVLCCVLYVVIVLYVLLFLYSYLGTHLAYLLAHFICFGLA